MHKIEETPAFKRSLAEGIDRAGSVQSTQENDLTTFSIHVATPAINENLETNSVCSVHEWALRETQELLNMNEPIKYFKKLHQRIENIAAKKGIKQSIDFDGLLDKKRPAAGSFGDVNSHSPDGETETLKNS